MHRLLQPGDMPAAMAIWREAFGDEDAFIDLSIKTFAGPRNVYVAEENGVLQAILSAIPCEVDGRKGVYLYALATAENQRGKGVMAALMHYAEQKCAAEGALFSCLIPANTRLFGYYTKQGYTCEMPLRLLEKRIPQNLLAQADFDTLTARELGVLRRRYSAESCVVFNDERTALLLGDLYSSGASSAISKFGYAVFFQQGDILLVPELMAENTPCANLLLQAMREKTGCARVRLSLAPDADIYSGEGRIQPFALLKPLQTNKCPSYYLRFGFEDVLKIFLTMNESTLRPQSLYQ